MSEARQFDSVNKEVPRLESWKKASGQAVYTDDIRLPNMAYAALVRSPYSRATLQAFFASFLLFFRFWTFSPVFLPVLSCFLLSILSYYNIEAERVLLRHFYPKSTRSYSYLIISSEVALDLEPIGTVLLFLHHDMLMVEVEVHRRTQIVVTGQAQQLLHPLLLLRHIE